MYCLKNYIVLLANTICTVMKSICIPWFTSIDCCVSELHAHLCPHSNVWPEAIYCGITMFTMLFTC